MSDLNFYVVSQYHKRLDFLDIDWEDDFLSEEGECNVLFMFRLFNLFPDISNVFELNKNVADEDEEITEDFVPLDWNETGLDFVLSEEWSQSLLSLPLQD